MLEAPQTEVTPKELRNFGLMMAGMISVFFGLLIPWAWSAGSWPVWPWVIASVFGVLGLLKPVALALVFKGWMKFAHVLGWFNTRVLLSVIFYLIIFPIGFVFKLLQKDPMERKFDEELVSYRKKSKQPSQKNLEKPF